MTTLNTRKTHDYYDIEQNCGHGWEVVSAADTLKEANDLLKDYRTNQPEYPVRKQSRRERRPRYTMLACSIPNPDRNETTPPSEPQQLWADDVPTLGQYAQNYIATYTLGGGNWPNCQVYDLTEQRFIGLFSYNGRYWTLEEHATFLQETNSE